MNQTIANLIEQRFGLPASAGHDMPAEGTVAGMISRRSMRRFKPLPIAQETMDIVLAAALSAPAKSDLQQASIIVVRDPALRASVTSLAPRKLGKGGRDVGNSSETLHWNLAGGKPVRKRLTSGR
jgi:nitroreductase/FMN reductase [NAD(P)H]